MIKRTTGTTAKPSDEKAADQSIVETITDTTASVVAPEEVKEPVVKLTNTRTRAAKVAVPNEVNQEAVVEPTPSAEENVETMKDSDKEKDKKAKAKLKDKAKKEKQKEKAKKDKAKEKAKAKKKKQKAKAKEKAKKAKLKAKKKERAKKKAKAKKKK